MDWIFRARSFETKEWLYGALIPQPYGICIQHMVDSTRHITRVDEATVGLWTGLTDKNGVKIFEKAKVKRTFPSGESVIGIVAFDPMKGFYLKPDPGQEITFSSGGQFPEPYTIEPKTASLYYASKNFEVIHDEVVK